MIDSTLFSLRDYFMYTFLDNILVFFLFFSSAYQSSENQISFTKINSFTEIFVFVCLFLSINSAKWSIYNTIKSSGPIIFGLLCCRPFLLDFFNCKGLLQYAYSLFSRSTSLFTFSIFNYSWFFLTFDSYSKLSIFYPALSMRILNFISTKMSVVLNSWIVRMAREYSYHAKEPKMEPNDGFSQQAGTRRTHLPQSSLMEQVHRTLFPTSYTKQDRWDC